MNPPDAQAQFDALPDDMLDMRMRIRPSNSYLLNHRFKRILQKYTFAATSIQRRWRRIAPGKITVFVSELTDEIGVYICPDELSIARCMQQNRNTIWRRCDNLIVTVMTAAFLQMLQVTEDTRTYAMTNSEVR